MACGFTECCRASCTDLSGDRTRALKVAALASSTHHQL
jgi:hypothetical protein